MLYTKIIIYTVIFVYYLIVFVICRKIFSLVNVILINTFTGLLCLFVLRFILKLYFNLLLPVNTVSVVASAVFGPIGLAGFIAVNCIFL